LEKKLVSRILIVSNHQTTGPLWVFTLRQQKFEVALEASPANAVQRCSEETPDLIIFDINWPENLTLELIKKLRAETIIPILFLSTSRDEDFLLKTYEAGIDDVIVKPMNPSLFLAKIRVWLKRAWTIPANILEPLKVGKIQLQPSERTVLLEDGKTKRLTNLEFRLLYFLMSRSGRAVTSDDLIQHLWGFNGEGDNTVLKNLIYRVRHKIEKDPANPALINTLPGLGYKFKSEAP